MSGYGFHGPWWTLVGMLTGLLIGYGVVVTLWLAAETPGRRRERR